MQSKNKPPMTADEREYVSSVKEDPCVVCDHAGPSDAHEIEQGLWWTSIPLCSDCHTGLHNGIHGRRAIWNVKKLTELRALNLYLQRRLAA